MPASLKASLVKWLLLWTILGLLIPMIVLLDPNSLSATEFVLWPTSVVLMGAPEGPQKTSLGVFKVYATAVVLNAALYFLVGLFMSPLFWIVVRKFRSRRDKVQRNV